ncbi:MAG: 2,3-diphosphoglycerate-dependent phosphoglycerate mutase [Muribaculaceae bacterium]|nr:2,3-diphosphoglycerate-dependent phosphoglycerate mutase [Muribaculaceae bacterium]
MKRIVLLRHGESQWNKENRFTGWTDVDLTDRGIREAAEAGRLLRENGFRFDRAYTSLLKRAVKTLDVVLDQMDLLWIPVRKSWRLNEKHYGILQGLDKKETAETYGEKQVLLWRRGYDNAPGPIPKGDPRDPRLDPRYSDIPLSEIPLTESLRDTINRTLPYWECEILPALARCGEILVVAHGNSLRGIIKHLKGISDSDIAGLNLPTATPWVFEFDDRLTLVGDHILGDADEIRRRMQAVADQAKA